MWPFNRKENQTIVALRATVIEQQCKINQLVTINNSLYIEAAQNYRDPGDLDKRLEIQLSAAGQWVPVDQGMPLDRYNPEMETMQHILHPRHDDDGRFY